MKKQLLSVVSLVLAGTTLLAAIPNQPGHQKFTMPKGITEAEYFHNKVVFKLNESFRNSVSKNDIASQEFNDFLLDITGTKVWKKFPNAEKPLTERNKYGFKYADLSLVYELEFNGNYTVQDVVNKLYKSGMVIYAQPHYKYKISYTPNDPELSTQGHLNTIKAYDAWNTVKGDTTVVIGIVDSGWDNDHEDLMDQLKHNYDDPINGIDDDNDGYVDNYNGWNFFEDNNDPQASFGADHGVHVSGCASADTDNGKGVGASGFNTMLLPLKAGGGTTIGFGYEGITYCADQGADIINCSWGGEFGGPLGQEVITYATINKDALVIAAAGNDNVETPHYPSSYAYVISVAATELNDSKSGYSNYGYDVDVCAPGTIYATIDGGGYNYNTGTSMASPVAAGAAAIIKSKYPFFNALQVGAQLEATCDDIYPQNSSYQGKLGSGRINMAEGVGPLSAPFVDMVEKVITDNGDDAFVVGDILSISGNFTNLLAPSGNLTATISCASPYINITQNTATLGVLSMMQSADNHASPFKAEILSGAPLNTPVTFQVDVTDGTYSWSYFITTTVNVDYINIAINDVATTITSKGMIGYNLDGQAEGLGFTYNQSASILWDAALMVGTPGKVVDMVRGAAGTSDQEFVPVTNVNKLTNPVFSEFDVEGTFDDAGAAADFLDIEVDHKAFAWTTVGHTKYVIVEYTITNTGSSDLSGLFAGIFGDWDVGTADQNRADTDAARRMGYTYDVNLNGIYAGVQLLTDGTFNHYAMFNNSADAGGANGVNPNDSYTSAEKYTSLSNSNTNAGGSTGADVSNVVSSGPHSINAGSSITVAFALIAGDNVTDLAASADSAYVQYNGVPLVNAVNDLNEISNVNVYPNPASNLISVSTSNVAIETIKLLDVTGKTVLTSTGNNQSTVNLDISTLSSGVYFTEVTTALGKSTQRIVKK